MNFIWTILLLYCSLVMSQIDDRTDLEVAQELLSLQDLLVNQRPFPSDHTDNALNPSDRPSTRRDASTRTHSHSIQGQGQDRIFLDLNESPDSINNYLAQLPNENYGKSFDRFIQFLKAHYEQLSSAKNIEETREIISQILNTMTRSDRARIGLDGKNLRSYEHLAHVFNNPSIMAILNSLRSDHLRLMRGLDYQEFKKFYDENEPKLVPLLQQDKIVKDPQVLNRVLNIIYKRNPKGKERIILAGKKAFNQMRGMHPSNDPVLRIAKAFRTL